MSKLTHAAGILFGLFAGALVLSTGGSVALAADPIRVRVIEGMESVALMTIDAQVVIEATGEVSQVRLDTKVEPALADSLERAVLKWRFQPVRVSGEARRVSTRLRLALAAAQEGDSLKVRIDGVDFPDAFNKTAQRPDDQPEPITGDRLYPPGYPPELQTRGIMGSVMLAIRVTPEGKAAEVMVVQSLLYEFNRPTSLSRHSAATFEKLAVNAARGWTFKVPSGPARDADAMTVTVPVEFNLGYATDTPGQWLKVQRSPKLPIRWLPASQARSGLGLASSGGGNVSQFGGGPKLLQDVAGTALQ